MFLLKWKRKFEALERLNRELEMMVESISDGLNCSIEREDWDGPERRYHERRTGKPWQGHNRRIGERRQSQGR